MELYDRLHQFLREWYYADLMKAAGEEKPSLTVDFSELDRFDSSIADMLLEMPGTVLEEFQKAVSGFDIPIDEKITVRVRNLPERRQVRIRNLRAEHIGKFLSTDVIVKSASEVKPQISEAVFQCPECDKMTTVPQDSTLIQKPASCDCGRRGDFPLIGKKMIDIRWLKGVEPFEITTGEQPSEIAIFLKEDLTTPRMQKKTDPGSRLRIVGVLKELPVRIKGKMTTKLDTYIEANHLETTDIEFEDIEINPEDEAKIFELARDPNIYERLKASIAPGIHGFDEIKESLALQLFGGVPHILPDGNRIRGNIHILITGDPGVGKSVVGSSRILHNSNDKLEYTEIGKLIDELIEKGVDVKKDDVEICLNKAGIRVLALNPKTHKLEWMHPSAFSKHPSPETLIKISTRSGREVIATKDHCFVTLDENCNIVPVRGTEITKRNYLPVPLNGHKEAVTDIEIPQEKRTNSIRIPEKIKLDWNFGFFLGMFLAEGCAPRGEIFIESNNSERKNIIKSFIESTGLKARTRNKRITISSKNLVRFLNNVCYKGVKKSSGKGSGAKRKSIPDFCFFAPYDFKSGLLSGLFSGDGYFTNARPSKGRTKGNLKIGYTTISGHLARELLEMLSLLGFFAVIRKKKYTYKGDSRTAYEITLLGRYAEKFFREIKMIGKKPIIQRFSEKDSFDSVPCGSLLCGVVKSMGYSRRLTEDSQKKRGFAAMMRTVKSRNKIGRRRIEKIYEKLMLEAKNQSNSEALEKLEKIACILNSDVVWDAIKSVEEIPSEENYVYDISVDGNETFIVNNIVVHNSMLLKLVSTIVPRGKYVSGSGVTGVGLTASVRKDEVIGGWILEAGALILCNKGLIAIDEFDKMSRDDQIAMHEATSVETVSIAKASIVATLPAQTAVLAGANPKLGRFDRYRPITEQLDIPETLLSRFDLKFALMDRPDRTQDEKLVEHIVMSRTTPETVTPEINLNLLRKYIAYAKKNESIELSKEAADIMEKFYVDMRNVGAMGEVATVSITLRQFEALLRLAEASAKIRLGNKIMMEDAERAIRLMRYSLMQLGMEPETGMVDIDRIESGVSAVQRSRIRVMLDILDSMQKEFKHKDISEEDVLAEAETQGVDKPNEILERLKREGMIFEPKPGFIRKIM